MDENGKYVTRKINEEPVNSQELFYEQAYLADSINEAEEGKTC